MALAPRDIATQLDAADAHLAEARAALALIEEGDPTALQELDATVDRLAATVADLKAQTAGGPF
jgi:predicted NBD/HSP70 family sugar kinase